LQGRGAQRLLGIAKLQLDDCVSIDQLAPGDFYSRSAPTCFPEHALGPSGADAHNFIKPIESIIIAKRPVVGPDDGSIFIITLVVGGLVDVDAVTVNVTVLVDVDAVAVLAVVVVVVDLVVVVVVVDLVVVELVVVVGVVVVVFADVASACVLSVTVSMSVTTGGVTMANRPHCSKNARRSAF